MQHMYCAILKSECEKYFFVLKISAEILFWLYAANFEEKIFFEKTK